LRNSFLSAVIHKLDDAYWYFSSLSCCWTYKKKNN
jgi:hypothetical protein